MSIVIKHKFWTKIKKNHIMNSFHFVMIILAPYDLILFQKIMLRKNSTLWLRKSAITFLVIADYVKAYFPSKKFECATRTLV